MDRSKQLLEGNLCTDPKLETFKAISLFFIQMYELLPPWLSIENEVFSIFFQPTKTIL